MTKTPITWMELLKMHMQKDGKSVGFKEASKTASKEWIAIKNGTNSTYEQKIGATGKSVKNVKNKKAMNKSTNKPTSMRMSRKMSRKTSRKSNNSESFPPSQSLTADNSNRNMIIRQILDICKLCSKCKRCIQGQMDSH